LRIDSHHSCSDQYTLAYLESILKRNRFERSIFVGAPRDVPDYVAGIIAPLAEAAPHPKLCGIQIVSAADLPAALAFGLPIDLLGVLPDVPTVAAAHPEVRFVVEQLGHPHTDGLEAAASFPNVSCKLAGLDLFDDPRAHVRRALALFGPGRLMFGSDWPRGLPDQTWKAKLALFTQSIGAQTIEIREELLGGTAARVYGLH
jgi:predicted TIM-barrel fold metal-dependent hydrolase